MVKFRVKDMGQHSALCFNAPQGSYVFSRGEPLEIILPEDVEYFRKKLDTFEEVKPFTDVPKTAPTPAKKPGLLDKVFKKKKEGK